MDGINAHSYGTATASADDGRVTLLVFGDSYVADPLVPRTWPILLAERLSWRVANFAVPGSGSSTLSRQLDRATQLVRAGQLQLHPNAWALVHTGGNDLMRSSVSALSVVLRAAVATALPLSLCSGGGSTARARTLCDEVAERIASLAEGLEDLGVRNVLMVGMPLTCSVPAVSQMCRAVAGADCGPLGGLVLRRLNSYHLGKLRAAASEVRCEGGQAVCLDEASSIDAALRKVRSPHPSTGTAHYSLLSTQSATLTDCLLLPTYLLLTAYYLPLTTYHLLLTTYCSLLTACIGTSS